MLKRRGREEEENSGAAFPRVNIINGIRFLWTAPPPPPTPKESSSSSSFMCAYISVVWWQVFPFNFPFVQSSPSSGHNKNAAAVVFLRRNSAAVRPSISTVQLSRPSSPRRCDCHQLKLISENQSSVPLLLHKVGGGGSGGSSVVSSEDNGQSPLPVEWMIKSGYLVPTPRSMSDW